jgi:hypothetical protein
MLKRRLVDCGLMEGGLPAGDGVAMGGTPSVGLVVPCTVKSSVSGGLVFAGDEGEMRSIGSSFLLYVVYGRTQADGST